MNQRDQLSARQAPLAFLAGGGEMGERIRAFDWTNTSLGAPENWPQSLKTAVRIMLTSRQPFWIGWGKELTKLYNDPYLSIIGGKHPHALGQPSAVVWREIWGDIAPLLSKAMTGDEGTYDEAKLLIMERNGYPEETHYTFSYSPIPDDAGGAGGIICANTDDTQRVVGERQLALLRELAAGTADSRTWQEACARSARALGTDPRDLPFAMIYIAAPDGRSVSLAGACGIERDHPAAPQSVTLDGPSVWPFAEVLRARAASLVRDLGTTFGGKLPTGAWRRPPAQAAVLPIPATGETGRTGVLVVGLNPFRLWDDSYQGFLGLVAGQIAASLANAQAYEEEKRRAEALAELDRAKTVFFSNVSHEFRTPLTLMLGPVEDMLARSYTDLPPAAAGQLEVVNRNGQRLLRLVNTLLDFSRIEAGRVRAVYQPTDLSAYTAELASNFRSACERAGLRLAVDCPALAEPVFVDRGMWEKIVLNLLSNAFKFTFTGEIEVSLRQGEPGALAPGGSAELRVRDTGTGVPAAELPRLFERFHRVQNAQGRTHEGSGIGLALVQELVKLHGGSIAATSVVGEGTTFTVRVPLGSAHLPPDQIVKERTIDSTGTGAGPYVEEALRWLPEQPGVRGQESGDRDQESAIIDDVGLRYLTSDSCPLTPDDRPRVLVADDHADMRQYVARLLAEHYRVEAVPDGEAALASARERPPDLVLTDVMMPRLDGFGLLRELRADERTGGLPVIMLSARAGEESRVEGMEAGADDYLVKPFSARELLARVTAHLQMARMRREASESLRESEQRYRLLFEQTVDGIFVADAEGRYVDVNSAGCEMLGYSREEVLARTFTDVLEPDEWPRIVPEVAKFADGQVVRSEWWFRRRDGSVFIGEVTGRQLPDGRLQGILRDVTERKQAEEALKEADRRKDEFLATLAHELRNPMAPLRNGLQVMKLARGNVEAVEQARAMMERQVEQLVRLVDDLLDLSRISPGKIELRRERVELAAVVRNAVEISRPLLDASRHEFRTTIPEEPIYVDADVTRLAQVFANLLNNAAKYTEQGGQVWLTVEQQGRDAVVSVRDTGIGIPARMLPKIFEMFTQVDRSLERSQGGLGIGLTLVQRLVDLHGGSVEAKSEGHGMGSEFVVRLPVVLSLAGKKQKEGGGVPLGPAARRRILVVDDNRDSATSLAMMLKMMGNDTQAAYDGLEAMGLAVTFRPDVILLDIGMPKLNGYDACRRIREQPWGKNIVLVALTGWGQEEDKRRSQEAGFNFHMVKPVDPAALEKLLAGLKTEMA